MLRRAAHTRTCLGLAFNSLYVDHFMLSVDADPGTAGRARRTHFNRNSSASQDKFYARAPKLGQVDMVVWLPTEVT